MSTVTALLPLTSAVSVFFLDVEKREKHLLLLLGKDL